MLNKIWTITTGSIAAIMLIYFAVRGIQLAIVFWSCTYQGGC